jgi:hypothetical protein
MSVFGFLHWLSAFPDLCSTCAETGYIIDNTFAVKKKKFENKNEVKVIRSL